MTHYQSLTPNIGVENVNDTVKFYKDFLGFELITSVPEEGNMVWAMMISGNACIMLQEKSNLMEEYPQLEKEGWNGCLTFFIRVKGFDDLYEKMSGTDSETPETIRRKSR